MSYKKFAQELYGIANQLDALGKRGLANRVDGIAEQLAKSAAPTTTSYTTYDGRSVPMLISPEESDAIRGMGGNPGAVDANRRLVEEGIGFTARGELSPSAIKDGFRGPIEVDGRLFAYKYDGTGMKDSVTLSDLRNANIGIGDATASLPVIQDMAAGGQPITYAVKPIPNGDARMWHLDGSVNDISQRTGGWFSHLGDDMKARYLSRMSRIPGMSMGDAASAAMRAIKAPKRGFATIPALALSFMTAGAVMLGLKDDDKDERLKMELDALEAIVKRQDGKDPATVRKIAEYALGKIKIIKSKIGEPGYQINSDQLNTLSQVESQLQDAMR